MDRRSDASNFDRRRGSVWRKWCDCDHQYFSSNAADRSKYSWSKLVSILLRRLLAERYSDSSAGSDVWNRTGIGHGGRGHVHLDARGTIRRTDAPSGRYWIWVAIESWEQDLCVWSASRTAKDPGSVSKDD